MTVMPTGPSLGARRKLITLSIPVYNEADNIERLLLRLVAFANSQPRYDFEFLFTDNASTDDTFTRLSEAAARDPRVRVLKFSRNFGFQKSILTNFLEARGDAAVQLDADLQDPPELIGTFLEHWERGYKVVYGIRRRRLEGTAITLARKAYYRVVSYLSDVDLPLDAGDFRLIDRTIIEHLRATRDQSPYLRGMIPQLGYAQVGVPYDRDARVAGETKFRLGSLMRLGLDGITSQSTKPLQMITLFGFVTCAVSVAAAGAYVSLWAMGAIKGAPGFTTLVLLMILSIGINALFLGILGEYLGRVFENVRNKPLTIVEHRVEAPVAAAAPTSAPAVLRERQALAEQFDPQRREAAG